MPNAILSSLKDESPKKDNQKILNFQNGGYVIHVGLNAFSNEHLVGDHPHRDCFWLHAMAARGSHVVLCVHNRPEPPDVVIQYAAGIALRFSKSEAKTVSIALLKDLFKPEDVSIGVWMTKKSASVEVL